MLSLTGAYAHPEASLYFYAYIVVGSFFAINLFVGVVLDKFSRLKSEFDGSALLTVEQQQWFVHVITNGRSTVPTRQLQSNTRLWFVHPMLVG